MIEKSLPQPSSPHVPGRRTFTPYVIIWAGAAIVSLLYLVLLVAQPSMVAGALGPKAEHTASDDTTQKALAENSAEVRNLRDTIDVFRNELTEMRAQISNQSDVTRDLANRVGTIETQTAETQKVAANDPAAKAKDAAAKKAAALKEAKEAAAKKAAAAKPEGALETGSVAQPATGGAISFGPATVTTTATPPPSKQQIGLQIATGPSVDSLRLSWTLLNERHGDSLRAFEPRYVTDNAGSEQTYDLVVGPVATVDEARKLCQELALKATPCTVSRFTGAAL